MTEAEKGLKIIGTSRCGSTASLCSLPVTSDNVFRGIERVKDYRYILVREYKPVFSTNDFIHVLRAAENGLIGTSWCCSTSLCSLRVTSYV